MFHSIDSRYFLVHLPISSAARVLAHRLKVRRFKSTFVATNSFRPSHRKTNLETGCLLRVPWENDIRYGRFNFWEIVLSRTLFLRAHNRGALERGHRHMTKESSIMGQVRHALEEGESILRLAPTWVPRSYLVPGAALKLDARDLYAYGADRGDIDERWIGSATFAMNENRTPDEGVEFCSVRETPVHVEGRGRQRRRTYRWQDDLGQEGPFSSQLPRPSAGLRTQSQSD